MTFLYNTKVFMDGKVLLDWKEAQAVALNSKFKGSPVKEKAPTKSL